MEITIGNRKFTLGDNGTLDTLINIECTKCNALWATGLGHEFTSYYRNLSGKITDFENMIDDAFLGDEYCPRCGK